MFKRCGSTVTTPPDLKEKTIQPAERGRILILLADRLLQNLDLDMAGFLRKLAGRNALAAKRVQRVEQADGKTARSAQTR